MILRNRRPSSRLLVLLLLVVTVTAGCSTPEERAAAYMAKAQKLYDGQNYDKARLEAQNALQVEPKNVEARYLLALISEQRGEIPAMFGNLVVAVDADPKHVPSRTKLGQVLFLAGDYKGAGEQADAALALLPNDPAARRLSARVEFTRKGREAGMQALAEILKYNPKDAETIVLQALAIAENDADEGLRRLTTAIPNVDKRYGQALRQARAEIYLKENRLPELEQEYQALIRDYPGGGDERRLLDFYIEQKRTADAERLMRALIDKDPKRVEARLDLARVQVTTGQTAAAVASLEAAIKALPDAPEPRLFLAELYEQDKRPKDAQAIYAALAARDPRSEAGLEARSRLVVLLLAAGEQERADELLKQVLADAPDFPSALLLQSELRIRAERYQDAIPDLRVALRKKPELARAWLLLARAHAGINEVALSEEAYRRLLVVDPRSVDGLNELGMLLFSMGRYDEAEKVHRDQLALKLPGGPVVWARLVDLLLAQGKLDAAATEARALQAVTGPAGLGDLQLAKVYDRQGKYAEAVALLKSILDRKPDSPRALQALIETMSRAGRVRDAVAYLETYVQKNPEQLQARRSLAMGLAATGAPERALALFEGILARQPDKGSYAGVIALATDIAQKEKAAKRALDAFPNDTEFTLALSNLYTETGRMEEAIGVYETAMGAGPVSSLIMNNLAALLLDYRKTPADLARALKMMQAVKDTKNPMFLDTLGWAKVRNDLPREALDDLKRAAVGLPKDSGVRYHLGAAYRDLQDTAGARQEFTKAVELAPAGSPQRLAAEAALEALTRRKP